MNKPGNYEDGGSDKFMAEKKLTQLDQKQKQLTALMQCQSKRMTRENWVMAQRITLLQKK